MKLDKKDLAVNFFVVAVILVILYAATVVANVAHANHDPSWPPSTLTVMPDGTAVVQIPCTPEKGFRIHLPMMLAIPFSDAALGRITKEEFLAIFNETGIPYLIEGAIAFANECYGTHMPDPT